MKQGIFTIISNTSLNQSTNRIELAGDTSAMTASGQFVNIRLEGKYLRRPISVNDYDRETVALIYKIVGAGTAQLSRMKPGETLDVLTGLGNGYNTGKGGERPLLIGGGVGAAPLYRLAKELIGQDRVVTAILGFNSREDAFFIDEFRALGARVVVTTENGSLGENGYVTDALPDGYSYFFCCGPEPMLKAVYKATTTSGQFSFEERMGCGFGACMGCSCRTVTGYKRICKDGPVLEKEEILWGN